MFDKKEKESLVSRLYDEVVKDGLYDMYSRMMFGGDDQGDKNQEQFTELLTPYFNDYMEEKYSTCKECGVLIVKGKESTVTIVNEDDKETSKETYCWCCTPLYNKVKVTRIYDEDGDSKGENKIYYRSNVECDEEGNIDE